MKLTSLLFSALALAGVSAPAAIKLETVEYKQGDTVLEGYVAYDDALTGKRPGVVIVHQWRGAGDYEKKRAEMLAQLGYVAFVADIYGKGVRPATPADAGKEAGKYKSNRNLLRARAEAALNQLKKHPMTDASRTAAMGYCFGGTTALEMARANQELLGVVSFHGGLSAQPGLEAKTVKPKVLVLHGAADPFVPAAEVEAFQLEMRKAKADLKFIAYPDTVHSFTDWSATGEMKGAKYSKEADEQSWAAMQAFFKQLFGK